MTIMPAATLSVLTAIILLGTLLSVVNKTYLDTSDPLIAHLPHPLHQSHYFANKSNILNVYFIKNAWAWTSAAFLLLWATSPPPLRTRWRWAKWAAATTAWLAFTSWFFGPAITQRVLAASGAECVLSLPSGDVLQVPANYCQTSIITTVSPSTHPALFAQTLLAPDWRGRPRLMRGHDISGHIFLLTLSTLFLVDQMRFSARRPQSSVGVTTTTTTTYHRLAIWFNTILIALWLFACWTTSLYFHSPMEKLSGYLVGVGSFAIIQLLLWDPPIDPAAKVE